MREQQNTSHLKLNEVTATLLHTKCTGNKIRIGYISGLLLKTVSMNSVIAAEFTIETFEIWIVDYGAEKDKLVKIILQNTPLLTLQISVMRK